MRNIYNYLICAMLVFTSSCNKFDDDINKDPNNPTKASATQLIANAEMYLPDMSSNAFGVHYPQYLSNTSFTENSRYATVNFDFYPLFAGPLMNLEEAIKSGGNPNDGPVVNQLAVAKVLKAYFFWHATDRWGALPYKEALKGAANFSPAYDTQQQIYDQLFQLLDEANAAFTAGNIKNDIVYNGDVGKWKRLGNTIHLLMALRLSKVDGTKGAAEFNKANTNGIMTGNTDNLSYPHLSEKAHENYWYNSFKNLGRSWFAVSKTLVGYMKPLNDPRLPIFANKNDAGEYVGLEYGLSVPDPTNTNKISLLGNALRQQNSPVHLVTYAQALFAKAEAAKLGWIPNGDTDAKKFYDMAIEQSVRQWNNNDISGLAAFIVQPQVAYDAATGFKQIAEQRWVHLFMHGYEGWAEWRRTGYPLLTPPANNNNLPIPRREAYPTAERTGNGDHYNAAVAAFPYGGSDNLNARVWWDKP